MSDAHRRLALTLGWVAVLALAAAYVQRTLTVGADLRLFMPTPRTAAERLLLEQVGEGPASRLLLVAIEGADAQALADASRSLAEALRSDPLFRWVANGERAAAPIPENLLPYRYLLTDSFDEQPLDRELLRLELTQRERDLASTAGGLLEDWLPRDPTLEVLKLAERWQPAREPQQIDDVWFDARGTRALLLAETHAAAFDSEGQRAALDALRRHFERVRGDPAARVMSTGPGTFSVLMKDRTAGEAQSLGMFAALGLIVLLLFAYRSPLLVLLGALPLASAAIAGLAAVSGVFGTVHGITLAFGFTLIGVAQDYPLHLFSHRQPRESPLQTARAVWPPLATGVASTCIAYLAFLGSGVIGLAQLAAFTIAGLAAAGLTTRYLLPRILPAATRDLGNSAALERAWSTTESLPARLWWSVPLALAALLAIVLAPAPLWQNDLSRLTPVPEPLLRLDAALRRELGAPDVRHLLVVSGASTGEVLERIERLTPELEALVGAGVIAAYDHPARYVPSRATQLRRQAALPDASGLRDALAAAAQGSAFREALFEPFIRDVARARQLPPLEPATLEGSPLELRVGNLLVGQGDRWNGLITVTGLENPAALEQLARRSGGAVLLDLKAASEMLVARQRVHILYSLAAAGVLLVSVVFVALRKARRVWRVVAPMLLTTLLLLAAFRVAGMPLNLFHLIALVLAAGLGLDYALFFEHAAADRGQQRRTLHAVTLCALSTLMVFALLALSSIPVLHAIGLTVAAGVVCNFVLALLLTRAP